MNTVIGSRPSRSWARAAALLILLLPARLPAQVVPPATTMAGLVDKHPSGFFWFALILLTILLPAVVGGIAIVCNAMKHMRSKSVDIELARLALRDMRTPGACFDRFLRAHCEIIVGLDKALAANGTTPPDGLDALVKACNRFLTVKQP